MGIDAWTRSLKSPLPWFALIPALRLVGRKYRLNYNDNFATIDLRNNAVCTRSIHLRVFAASFASSVSSLKRRRAGVQDRWSHESGARRMRAKLFACARRRGDGAGWQVMEETNDIAELGEMLGRLQATDRSFRVFGSEAHRYMLRPALSESELAAFESTNRIRLPDDYRRFLAVVCNGEAGPYYGLAPLVAGSRDLSRPFPLTTATNELTDESLEQPNALDYPGLLEVCHQGCAIYSYLVVNGPAHGRIWEGREDLYPTGLTFCAWYRRWLELALQALDNERRLVPRLRVGMSSAEVVAEVGADWKARPYPSDEALRLFEANNIPAQLVLDQRDVVVAVRPWRFILGRPVD